MKRVACALAGAVAAVAVGHAVAGCSWMCASSSMLRAGSFRLDTAAPQFLDDYELVVDDAFTTVRETFVLDGHRWERTYRVTAKTNVHD
jgi:hypothetical protein